MIPALDSAIESIGFTSMQNTLKPVINAIENGESLCENLERADLFPSMVINMLRTGEESGRTTEMLGKISELLSFEAESSIERIGTLLPLIIYVGVMIWISTEIFELYRKVYIAPLTE